jgi:hypothetical protein
VFPVEVEVEDDGDGRARLVGAFASLAVAVAIGPRDDVAAAVVDEHDRDALAIAFDGGGNVVVTRSTR